MVEFGLALPIMLLVVYGLIETGRLVFIYASVVSAARQAARYGSVTGVNGSGTPYYNDCAGHQSGGQEAGLSSAFNDANILISYDNGPGRDSADFGTSCPLTAGRASRQRRPHPSAGSAQLQPHRSAGTVQTLHDHFDQQPDAAGWRADRCRCATRDFHAGDARDVLSVHESGLRQHGPTSDVQVREPGHHLHLHPAEPGTATRPPISRCMTTRRAS